MKTESEPRPVAFNEDLLEICELCGLEDETRPYGTRMESGRRMNICVACGLKNISEVVLAYLEDRHP